MTTQTLPQTIEILPDPVVSLIDHMGSDASVTKAARVSTGADREVYSAPREQGLINYLMKSRHGSPFEHATMTFYVKAPIFVFREFQRHRIASYNEMSGRYTTLPPEFWIPHANRPLINVGTSARPEMAPGTPEQYELVADTLMEIYEVSWDGYKRMVEAGIANEVARAGLPVGIFSQMYVTVNLRALMNFLSLRVDSPDAAVRSRPQMEIQATAEQIEDEFAMHFPQVYAAFVDNGRQAP